MISVAHQMIHALEVVAVLALFAFCIDFRREIGDLWAEMKADSKNDSFADDRILDFDREV